LEIRYTLHALERIAERRISGRHILLCLEEPDRRIRQADTIKCVKDLGDKLIIVVYRVEGDTAVVITAFYTTKKRKYLSNH